MLVISLDISAALNGIELGFSTVGPIRERRTEFLIRHALGILNILVAAYLCRKTSDLALFVMYSLPSWTNVSFLMLAVFLPLNDLIVLQILWGIELESESSRNSFHIYSLLSLIISRIVIHASIHSARLFVMYLLSAFRLFTISRMSLDIHSFPLTLHLTLPIALLAASIIAMFRNLDLESREDSCMAAGADVTASSTDSANNRKLADFQFHLSSVRDGAFRVVT